MYSHSPYLKNMHHVTVLPLIETVDLSEQTEPLHLPHNCPTL
jgi:hypothetical protein